MWPFDPENGWWPTIIICSKWYKDFDVGYMCIAGVPIRPFRNYPRWGLVNTKGWRSRVDVVHRPVLSRGRWLYCIARKFGGIALFRFLFQCRIISEILSRRWLESKYSWKKMMPSFAAASFNSIWKLHSPRSIMLSLRTCRRQIQGVARSNSAIHQIKSANILVAYSPKPPNFPAMQYSKHLLLGALASKAAGLYY